MAERFMRALQTEYASYTPDCAQPLVMSESNVNANHSQLHEWCCNHMNRHLKPSFRSPLSTGHERGQRAILIPTGGFDHFSAETGNSQTDPNSDIRANLRFPRKRTGIALLG
jgi:hypothetical protein